MTPTQQKFSINDQELLALVAALEKWAHLLRATKVADALSRFPCHTTPGPQPSPIALPETPLGPLAALGLAPDPPDPPHETRGTHIDYRKLAGVRNISLLASKESLGLWGSQGPWEWTSISPFPEFLTHVLYTHRDHVTAGHRGQKKTYTALTKHYYWPGMRTYTNSYVESCTQCRASKSLNQKPAGLLQQLLIPSRRWSHVSLDFVTDLPLTTSGHDAILVVVDSRSKMAHFIPAKKSHTAADTVELLADRLIRYHGFPDVLVSDRDPRFQSEVWSQLCSRFNITRAMSSSYHPQTDDQTERVNRTLEQMLRTYVQADEREWEGLLPALELAHNTTSHSSTELSPFEIMVGENPLTAADLDIVGVLAPTLTPPMTKLFRQLCDRAQSHQEAPVCCPPTRDEASNPTEQYFVDYTLDQKGTGPRGKGHMGTGASPRRVPCFTSGVEAPPAQTPSVLTASPLDDLPNGRTH
ncbi:Similar to Transposon MAGGYgagandpolgenehomologues, related [Eimeria brunetti]|uniref:Similar to Transposon MAGGYgagandpolgenehomologues, related n=1 Tax=Eimeria brunetti TaxID=51314 RepID=U6LSB8_9EIME|nr:Similar to Transposon MAGGYgagandpolgenehomologues, related [Eimeria brunetti]